jgi:hypothetical protein
VGRIKKTKEEKIKIKGEKEKCETIRKKKEIINLRKNKN